MEHGSGASLPTMANTEPASSVIQFVAWLKSHGISYKNGRAVDIGSGKGRNSVFLAKEGMSVDGLDYIKEASECALKLAKRSGVEEHVRFQTSCIDETWSFDDDTFDIAIDSFSSIDIETLEGRKRCRNEMLRTLKPGGYALVSVCSADDEWEKELIANHPGAEPNSTVWPQNGKFQKDYSEKELREFYGVFEVVMLEKIKKPAYKLGRHGTATNFWLVLKKPQLPI